MKRVQRGANQRGWIFWQALPIICCVLVLLGLFSSALVAEARILSRCRTFVFQHQTSVSQDLNRLFKLNPKAMKLTLLRKATQARLAAALASGNPVAIAYARKADLAVHKKQLILRADQTTQLARIHFQNSYVPVLLNSLRSVGFGSIQFSVSKSARLKLRALHPESLTPVWAADPTTSGEQNLKVQYRFSQNDLVSKAALFDASFRNLKGECAASIEYLGREPIETIETLSRKGDLWVARITKDNLFSKSSGSSWSSWAQSLSL